VTGVGERVSNTRVDREYLMPWSFPIPWCPRVSSEMFGV
jgi:hypothetical protein